MSNSQMRCILHLTDQHFPYHDPRAISDSLYAIEILRPDILVLGGDLIDAPGISRFERDPRTITTLQSDIDQANNYIDDCLSHVPSGCHTVFTTGNHEDRLPRYMHREAPAAASLRALAIPNLLKLKERGITCIPLGRCFRIGALSFTHGDLIRKWSGSSAHASIDHEGCNIVMGHSHRLGSFTRKTGNRLLRGFESGCLCSTRPHYMQRTPDWHRGFSVFFLWGPALQSFSWFPVWLDQPNPLQSLEILRHCIHTRRPK